MMSPFFSITITMCFLCLDGPPNTASSRGKVHPSWRTGSVILVLADHRIWRLAKTGCQPCPSIMTPLFGIVMCFSCLDGPPNTASGRDTVHPSWCTGSAILVLADHRIQRLAETGHQPRPSMTSPIHDLVRRRPCLGRPP